jgi:hypothetical protein
MGWGQTASIPKLASPKITPGRNVPIGLRQARANKKRTAKPDSCLT